MTNYNILTNDISIILWKIMKKENKLILDKNNFMKIILQLECYENL
jgi:hypothetical protein